MITSLRRFSTKYSQGFIERLLNVGNEYEDARHFKDYDVRELKKNLPKEFWDEITKGHPLINNPDFDEELLHIRNLRPV